jgi:hypothetical protein
MRFLGVAVVLAMTACGFARDTFPDTPEERTCYWNTDSLLYNHVALELRGDGTYSVRIRGDIGDWGSATGHWRASSSRLFLTPVKSEGSMDGFPESLRKSNGGGLWFPGRFMGVQWTDLKSYRCG